MLPVIDLIDDLHTVDIVLVQKVLRIQECVDVRIRSVIRTSPVSSNFLFTSMSVTEYFICQLISSINDSLDPSCWVELRDLLIVLKQEIILIMLPGILGNIYFLIFHFPLFAIVYGNRKIKTGTETEIFIGHILNEELYPASAYIFTFGL